jgi:hypothetical protein
VDLADANRQGLKYHIIKRAHHLKMASVLPKGWG